jgi:hypothetical protein
MTLPSWPALLPATPLRIGGAHSPVANTVPHEPEVGEVMTRRRFTGRQEDLQTSLVLTPEQTVIFRSFHRDTLKDGALRFSWDDPVTGEAAEAVFLAPPGYGALGRNWSVTLRLRFFLL